MIPDQERGTEPATNDEPRKGDQVTTPPRAPRREDTPPPDRVEEADEEERQQQREQQQEGAPGPGWQRRPGGR